MFRWKCKTLVAAALLTMPFYAATSKLASAQAYCPGYSMTAKVVSGSSYTISGNDFCTWVVFTASGGITVNLPSNGLLAGFNTGVLPLNGTITLQTTVPTVGSRVTVNGANTASLGSSQGAEVRIGVDGNWYAISGGAQGAGTGSVTSVNASVPAWLSVSGGPITTAGTLAITGSSQSANLVLASPNGSSGAVTPRAIVSTDYATTLSSAFDTAFGTTQGGVLYRNASSWVYLAPGTNGQFLTSGGSGANVSWTTGGGGGSGTVTSVGLTVPGSSLFGVTGSPVTTSGNLGLTTTGTSGGVPYFSSGTALSTSGALTLNGVVLGGGAGGAPTSTAVGTSGQVLTSNGGGSPPTFQTAGGSSGISGLTTGQVGIAGSSTTLTSSVPFGTTGNNTLVETSGAGLVNPAVLPLATTGAFGAVKPDGSTVTISAGVISSTGGTASPDTVVDSLSAAGTNQGSCTVLTGANTVYGIWYYVTTVSANQGVCLPAAAAGIHRYVCDDTATDLNVYAAAGGTTINGASSSAALTVRASNCTEFGGRTTTAWHTNP